MGVVALLLYATFQALSIVLLIKKVPPLTRTAPVEYTFLVKLQHLFTICRTGFCKHDKRYSPT